MTRIRQPTTLPPLADMLPRFKGLKGPHSQSAELLAVLRGVAARLRTSESSRFYTTRTVAAFFRVSNSIAGLPHRFVPVAIETVTTDLAPVEQAPGDALIFPDHYVTQILGRHAPAAFAALLRRPRATGVTTPYFHSARTCG